MRYACRTGYHERCPGRWCTCPCHQDAEEAAMPAQEWTRDGGTTNAPGALEEAELLELGRWVAMERGYQSVLFDDPADYA
jgi:hypothetical protein